MSETLGILAAAATAACFGTLVWVHLRPTGYDPLRDAVSDYGVGPSLPFYRAQTAAMALAAILVAGGLARAIDPAPQRVIVLLAVFAGARLAIPFFPTDLDRTRRTTHGVVHALLAVVAFATVAWAAATLPHRVHWTGMAALGIAVVVTAVATGLSIRARFAYFGLVERAFYVAVLLWLLVVSLKLA
jgi:hypothetical protein